MRLTAKEVIILTVLLVLGTYFGIKGIVVAKAFLAPVAVALLLAMILMPLCNFLERKKFNRGWASFSGVLIALLFVFALFFVLSLQVKRVADDWPKIEKRMKPQIRDLQQWVASNTGFQPEEQNKVLKEKMPGGSANSDSVSSGSSSQGGSSAQGRTASDRSQLVDMIGKNLLKFFNFVGVFLLTFIYIFFILQYRRKLRLSFLKFFPENRRQEALAIAVAATKVSQNYLLGRLFLILILAICYSVGLLISGVDHAILISILAAFLSLLPYIGNIIGYGLALAMAAFSGGQLGAFAGVTITFMIAQFIESYILEPYIVGRKVDLNPLATIVVVVFGSIVWGVVGMVISIPVFGILKIIFDHIKVLRPLGYTLGEEDIDFKDENFMERMIRKITS